MGSSKFKSNCHLFKIILYFCVLSLIINGSINAMSCNNYTCNNFDKDSNICSQYTPVNRNGFVNSFNVSVQLCGGSLYCDMSGSLSNTTITSYYCKEKNIYPLCVGEKCKQNSDCASGNCDGHCKGKTLGNACTSTGECDIGTYCDSKTKLCTNQKKATESCVSDEECFNIGGCLKGKCTQYWTLQPGAEMNDTLLAESYCKTGFAYDGRCATIINIETNPFLCTNSTCSYTIKENNKIISLPEFCSCGFNSQGLQYCQHDSESITFKKFVELSQSLLNQTCHVTKKFSCSNQINYMDIINRQNYYLAWKGKFQNQMLVLLVFILMVLIYGSLIFCSSSLF